MFLLIFLTTAATSLYSVLTKGPGGNVRHIWWCAVLLVPTWLTAQQRSIELDLRTAAAGGCLCGILCVWGSGIRFRWLFSDTCICVIVGVQIASQFWVGDLRPLTSFEIAREWLLPYSVGRFFLRSTQDIANMHGFARIAAVLSILAIVEAFAQFNLLSVLTGKSFGLLEQGEGYRWGLKRAQGSFVHPIFFGLGLIMIMPWALEASRLVDQKAGKRWWRILPWLVATAIFVTVSRGPQMALGGVLFFNTFFRRPAWRSVMATAAIVVLTVGWLGKDTVMSQLSAWAGEDSNRRIIVINGEESEYSGTLHRLLLFSVYQEALEQTGLFGHGVRLIGVEAAGGDRRFASIDNHYLLFTLQHGYGGLLAFAALAVCALRYTSQVALNHKSSASGIAGALFGSLFAVDLLLMTVWFAPDFGAVWLFSTGLAGCLYCLPDEPICHQDSDLGHEPAGRNHVSFRDRSLSLQPIPL